MIISQTAQYALRAVAHLWEHRADGPLRVDDIASALDVPRNYLSKILHTLARAGLLVSTRGPNGGFELARPAADLLLTEVLDPFGPLPDERQCLLGQDVCSDRDPCRAHARWKHVATAVRDFFNQTTVAELVGGQLPAGLGQEDAPV